MKGPNRTDGATKARVWATYCGIDEGLDTYRKLKRESDSEARILASAPRFRAELKSDIDIINVIFDKEVLNNFFAEYGEYLLHDIQAILTRNGRWYGSFEGWAVENAE